MYIYIYAHMRICTHTHTREYETPCEFRLGIYKLKVQTPGVEEDSTFSRALAVRGIWVSGFRV